MSAFYWFVAVINTLNMSSVEEARARHHPGPVLKLRISQMALERY